MTNFEYTIEPDPEGMDSHDYDEYEDRCENTVDKDGNLMDEPCGGKVWVTGGHGYYNGHYDCYTLFLHCENCGPYEVECV